MWITFAFISALCLGCYDICKKYSLKDNAVIPVLFLNTLFCTIIAQVIPITLGASFASIYIADIRMHMLVGIKSIIVLSSWILGYYAIKHLPLTISAPINATRPIMTLMGAFIIFGEQLNLSQWIGVALTIASLIMLSLSGKKEGITFTHNRWVFCTILAAILGATSGLYDKFLMSHLNHTLVLFWYNFYQCLIMGGILIFIWMPRRNLSTPFRWKNSIVFISIFLTLADFIYFYALTNTESMISVVSMVRRSSVVISFIGGVIFFQEKNIKHKTVALLILIMAMIFLYLGTTT